MLRVRCLGYFGLHSSNLLLQVIETSVPLEVRSRAIDLWLWLEVEKELFDRNCFASVDIDSSAIYRSIFVLQYTTHFDVSSKATLRVASEIVGVFRMYRHTSNQ